jgi:hypothetical protein
MMYFVKYRKSRLQSILVETHAELAIKRPEIRRFSHGFSGFSPLDERITNSGKAVNFTQVTGSQGNVQKEGVPKKDIFFCFPVKFSS